MKHREGAGRIIVTVLGLLVAIGIAASTLWPVYESAAFVVAVAVAGLVGCLIGVLGALRRWPAYLVLAATVVGYLVIGVPLGIPSQAAFSVLPTPQGFVDLLAATALSWKQLLTIVTPVGSYQALLVPVVILVLITAVTGSSIALRARHGELAVLAPIALFVAAILLGPERAQAPIETALCLGIVSLLQVMLAQRRRRAAAIARVRETSSAAARRSDARRSLVSTRALLTAAIVLAVAVAGGTAASVAYPASAERDVLRTRVQQQFDPRDYPSPLSGFRRYLAPDQAARTMLTVEGLPKDARIRLAAMDAYDGVVYSVGAAGLSPASGSFSRLPYRLDQSGIEGTQTQVSVTVQDYRGVWVPGVGPLQAIRFGSDDAAALTDGFYYNDLTTTAAVLGGLRTGDSYRLDAVLPRSTGEIASLRPGTAVLPPITVLPDGVQKTLEDWTDPAAAPGARLAAVIEEIKTIGYVSHGIRDDEPLSRSGHGADRITQLLTDQPMVGDAEQYSVLAALMARTIGFPARVVMGFAPAVQSGGGSIAVTGSDVTAWIEVQDSSGSWLAIDPNPLPRPVPEKQPDRPEVVSRPQVVLPPPPEEPDRQQPLNPPQQAQDDEPPAANPFLAVLMTVLGITGWTLAGLAVLVSPFLAVIAAKLRRRRLRQRAPTPRQRIEGGWREFADVALDRGYPLPAAATRSEAAEVVGGMPSLVLATAVDRAVFSPEEATEAEADEIWQGVGDIRMALDGRLTRWQRLRAMVSLRSLRPPVRKARSGS